VCVISGGLPGPVLFGFAIDHSCLLWEQSCDGTTGACLYYDNHEMGWLLLAVCAACKVLTVVCGLLGWRLYVRQYVNAKVPQTAVEYMLSLQQTGNGQTENGYGSTDEIAADVEADEALGISNPSAEALNGDLGR